MKLYQLTESQLTSGINDALEVYLDILKNEGVIAPELFTELVKYKIVAERPGFFGRLWAKWTGLNQDDVYYVVIKVMGNYKQPKEQPNLTLVEDDE